MIISTQYYIQRYNVVKNDWTTIFQYMNDLGAANDLACKYAHDHTCVTRVVAVNHEVLHAFEPPYDDEETRKKIFV